jgi:prophage antirepressor-like protein
MYKGIDPKNKAVQEIIIKIRDQSGSLVGQEAVTQARAAVNKLLDSIQQKELDLKEFKASLEAASHSIIRLDNGISESERR